MSYMTNFKETNHNVIASARIAGSKKMAYLVDESAFGFWGIYSVFVVSPEEGIIKRRKVVSKDEYVDADEMVNAVMHFNKLTGAVAPKRCRQHLLDCLSASAKEKLPDDKLTLLHF